MLVLPGNHDFYAGDDTEVWKRFQKVSSECSNIELLTTTSVVTFEVSGETVQFFPCPCPSKTGKDPVIAWITDVEKTLSALRIGIAHGNVTGLGMDANDHYFTMTMPDLEAIGLTTWLLGHIHVPFPTTTSGSEAISNTCVLCSLEEALQRSLAKPFGRPRGIRHFVGSH